MTNSASCEMRTPAQMAEFAEGNGVAKISKDTASIFGLGISAGVFIALGFAFYVTVVTGASESSWGLSRLLGGVAFSMGLGLIVVCGGELFTSSVLGIVARASGKVRSAQLLRYWATVYAGNLLGALLMVLLFMLSRSYELNHAAWGLSVMRIAQHKLHHGFADALALGVLCNILVCLAVWMTYSSRNAVEKSILVMLPVAMFVSTGFEHVVANMFIVPLGLAIQASAGAQFWAEAGVSASQFADLSWGAFLLNNVVPVTLGNILGGLAVGLGYWFLYCRRPAVQANDVRAATRLAVVAEHRRAEN